MVHKHQWMQADYAIEIAKKDKCQLIALTIFNISTPRRLSSSFITAPTYGLKELEEDEKKKLSNG